MDLTTPLERVSNKSCMIQMSTSVNWHCCQFEDTVTQCNMVRACMALGIAAVARLKPLDCHCVHCAFVLSVHNIVSRHLHEWRSEHPMHEASTAEFLSLPVI